MDIKNSAIIVAAGSGSRMGTKVKKQYLMLDDMPVLAHTLKAYEESIADEIILVVARGEEDFVKRDIVEKFRFEKVTEIVAGGETRTASVYEGLKVASGEIVLVHDGARPFVKKETIREACLAAERHKACIVACRAIDTIKIANEEGVVTATPNRDTVWAVQTPQAFERRLLLDSYNAMLSGKMPEGITDDSMVVERYSDTSVVIVEGDYDNIKITTPGDILFAKEIINSRRKTEKNEQ